MFFTFDEKNDYSINPKLFSIFIHKSSWIVNSLDLLRWIFIYPVSRKKDTGVFFKDSVIFALNIGSNVFKKPATISLFKNFSGINVLK